jgi:hypothetical protein
MLPANLTCARIHLDTQDLVISHFSSFGQCQASGPRTAPCQTDSHLFPRPHLIFSRFWRSSARFFRWSEREKLECARFTGRHGIHRQYHSLLLLIAQRALICSMPDYLLPLHYIIRSSKTFKGCFTVHLQRGKQKE